MLTQSLSILAQSDTFAVIEFLDQQEDQLEVAQTYSELVKHLYWKDKNVPDMIALARAGIQYAIDAGSQAAKQSIEQALELRSWAKTIAYNLASYTWAGWDEPGITLSKTEQGYGLDAARMNLRLAFELDKGDMRISRGFWMKSAHLLSAGQLAAARLGFEKAAVYATRDGAEADKLIAQGFEQLVDLLKNPQNLTAQSALSSVKSQLKSLEHGDMYIDQIDTAWRVFN